MVSDALEPSDDAPGPELEEDLPERTCAQCGHGEGEHVEQDTELPGGTVRRIFCAPCEGFHDFVPDPLDL